MAENTPSNLGFFKVYDWLVCNIDTELREPTVGAGEHMRLYLRSEPSDLTKALILKYMINATPGMPEYVPFRHPEQAPGILYKRLKTKVEWLPFAAVSLECMLMEASNKLKEMGISLYKFNDDDIYDVKSLQLLHARHREPETASTYLNLQRNAILRQLVSKPEKERTDINKLFYDYSKRILFLNNETYCKLTKKEQALFDYLKSDERDVQDICDEIWGDREKRNDFDSLKSDLNKNIKEKFGIKLVRNTERGEGIFCVGVKITDKNFKK